MVRNAEHLFHAFTCLPHDVPSLLPWLNLIPTNAMPVARAKYGFEEQHPTTPRGFTFNVGPHTSGIHLVLLSDYVMFP